MMNKFLKSKRAILGLNTTTQFIVTLLVLSVTAFAVIIALSALGDTEVAKIQIANPVVFTNEVTQAMNVTNPYQLSGTLGLTNCVASFNLATNNSDGEVITSGNYTTSGCTITAVADPGSFNNTLWNVTGNYVYDSNAQINTITGNVSVGVASFFGNATTWFSLLAIVVILLIIAIVIITVRRFEVGGSQIGGAVSGSPGL